MCSKVWIWWDTNILFTFSRVHVQPNCLKHPNIFQLALHMLIQSNNIKSCLHFNTNLQATIPFLTAHESKVSSYQMRVGEDLGRIEMLLLLITRLEGLWLSLYHSKQGFTYKFSCYWRFHLSCYAPILIWLEFISGQVANSVRIRRQNCNKQ